MNFFRGTGIRGLKGIEPKHEFIVRPLLFARRTEMESFLEEHMLKFVTDISNQADDYTRNYFRHQIIPVIAKSFPEVNDNMLDNISRFREVEQLYQQAIAFHKKKLLEVKGKEVHIPVLKLKKAEPLHSIIFEIIKEYSFSSPQADEVMALLDSDTGKYVQSHSHRVIKNRNWLIIAPNEAGKSETVLIEEGDKNVQCTMLNLQLSISEPENLQPATCLPNRQTINQIACLDADEIKFPLLLRKWKQGDYFYPLGMKKKKKLARFFIDQKLSKTDKEKVWVIEMDKKILWVVGYRIDDRFKVTHKTKKILKITSTP
jgi:tRNA(Ile)-lysidine synthase